MKKLVKYVFSGFQEEYKSFLPRKSVIRVFLPVGILLNTVYGFISFTDPKTYWLGWIMVISQVVVLSMIPIIRRTKNAAIAANTLAFVALPVLIPWIITGGPLRQGFYFTIIWVIWVFLLLGRRQAIFWMSVLFISTLVVVTLNQLGFFRIAYSLLEVAQILFMVLISGFLLFVYDRQREFYENLSFKALEELQKKK